MIMVSMMINDDDYHYPYRHKIHTISGNIYCCAAGTSADCDQVTRQASHYLSLLR